MPTDVQRFIAEIRGRRSRAAAPTPLPPDLEPALRQVDATADLLPRFAAAARRALIDTSVCGTSDWPAVAAAALAETSVRSVVLAPASLDPRFARRRDELVEALAARGIAVHEGFNDDTLFSVDAGLTGVLCAVAETGSLVCPSGSGCPRGVSLIPPALIAVLHADQIVPDLIDAFDRIAPRVEACSNVNLITGPSKTADVEGVLVTGVHGPGRVCAIVVQG